jgi:putative SOS response-associated peptidase YedK
LSRKTSRDHVFAPYRKKSLKEVPATFNARSDTVTEKPMFRSAFEHLRCIIPASGYYEWQMIKGRKQPYYFSAPNGGVLSIAGLWDQWKDLQTEEPLISCTMIVTDANKFAGRIHDRMPVFLADDRLQAWLDNSAGAELLRPAPDDLLQMWPASPRVNCPVIGEEDPTLIEPIEPVSAPSLF